MSVKSSLDKDLKANLGHFESMPTRSFQVRVLVVNNRHAYAE